MAAVFDFNVDQGSTKRFDFVWSHNTGTVDVPIWTPYVLDSCTAKMQVRLGHGKPVIVELTDTPSAEGSLTLGANPGQVDVWLSDEGTDLINNKTTHYDLEITFPSGDTFRVIQGKITCSLAITQ